MRKKEKPKQLEIKIPVKKKKETKIGHISLKGNYTVKFLSKRYGITAAGVHSRIRKIRKNGEKIGTMIMGKDNIPYLLLSGYEVRKLDRASGILEDNLYF